MRRVTVPERCPDGADREPSEAARKRAAVELIRRHDRPLRWTARRFSICAEDAEDAYQRGIEILLSKAPTTDSSQLLPWTRTVIKHEALAIRKTRERTMGRPGPPPDPDHVNEDWVQLIPAEGDGPDELTVRRERVARSKEALGLLKPAELKALTQLAEGFSYAEIGEMNDWTRTKVNRCLAEGRARFRSAFSESEQGERCPDFEPLISACCDGQLEDDRLEELENHLAACGYCRTTLRAYRAAPRAAAALAPAVPFGHGAWERVQEFVLGLQLRLQGIGRGADSGLQGAVASGGSGGVAATVKLAALCAGTAGTAAVCAATGVVPAVDLAPRHANETPVERTAGVPSPAPPRPEVSGTDDAIVAPAQDPEPDTPASAEPSKDQPEGPVQAPPAVPEPTPVQAEFTPEAAGTPAPSAPPPPKATSSQVPIGNGGGEFAP